MVRSTSTMVLLDYQNGNRYPNRSSERGSLKWTVSN